MLEARNGALRIPAIFRQLLSSFARLARDGGIRAALRGESLEASFSVRNPE